MGVAISGMHYTAMGGTTFAAHGPVPEARGYASLDQTNLALAIAGTTFVILASALIASLSEQKRAEEALREAQAGRLSAADNSPRGASFHLILPTSSMNASDHL
jgi:hypothetical protein